MQGYTHFFPIAYSATDVAIYQQDVVIHRSEGVSYEETVGVLKVWHVYVGDRCKSDYGDIRFTDSTGAELAYYLWPDYSSESARFTVRLEGADAAGELLVWYGNPSAATTSDISVIPARYTDIGDHSYIVPAGIRSVSVLVVAGGGAAGRCTSWGAGGGGAGGLIFEESYSVTPGEEIPVRVGAGGVPGASAGDAGGNGGDSIFGNLTAIGGGGGGGGGGASSVRAKSGGSGGGGGYMNDFGAGTPGQGHAGGRSNMQAGAGGGGAGGPGNNAVSQSVGGVGGPGLRIWGDLYAVGGSGVFAAAAEGGSAGGAPGAPNTGNGGSATTGQATTGHGGSGIVIVSIGSPWSDAPPAALTLAGAEPAPEALHHVQGVVFGSANMMVI